VEVALKPKHGLFAGVAVVVLAVCAWLVFGGGDAPAELTLGDRAVVDDAVESVETSEPPVTYPPAVFTNVVGCDTPSRVTDVVDNIADVGRGRYSVVEGSIAGYRVVEDFIGGLVDVDAVGRTTAIQGDLFSLSSFNWTEPTPLGEEPPSTTAAPSDESLASLWFCVDVASITSDRDSRDSRFRGPIMDTANFPTATFTATPGPFSQYLVSDIPETGSATFTVPGFLVLAGKGHAAKASVEIQRAELPYAYELVAQIPVVFSDFGIDNPSNTVVSVRDEGLIEVSLTFAWNPAPCPIC
jgi:polyisoprenoid-binding protein YceI